MRYSINGNTSISKTLSYDVVIIGAGIAGMYTALNIDSKYSCCILAKEGIDISNSWLAQGGIAAAISSDDAPIFHLEDTVIAGAGLCDESAVRVLVDEGPAEIKKLVELRVPFDLDKDGDLEITREGGHRKNRIVHAGGDATGRETVKALTHVVSQLENVQFMEHSFFCDIITGKNGDVSGIVIENSDNEFITIKTSCVVLATGGIGQVYLSSTNPVVATGDGLAAAMRAGANLSNMEFIQFHPTGLWSPNPEATAFLISEAVRGEGGLLKNSDGVRFMEGKHELNELAPRDIVARGIISELARSGEDHVFVDITAKSDEYLQTRFPTIYNECLRRGINISKDYIPVCPVQHYLIGGIKTDQHARTNIPGLYACGEVASTGVHGANRLASNSMLECLVFGRRAAECIHYTLNLKKKQDDIDFSEIPVRTTSDLDFSAIRHEIQQLMTAHGYVIRNEIDLKSALSRVSDICTELESVYFSSKSYFETLNIATVAKSILEAALARTESAGSHYRED